MNTEQQAAIASIRERMKELKFPKSPRPDWEGTNHYEITRGAHDEGDHWWITGDAFSDDLLFDGFEGQRVGLVLDMACAFPALLAENERLRATLREIANTLGPAPGCGDCCEGCEVEMQLALEAAKKALGKEEGQ